MQAVIDLAFRISTDLLSRSSSRWMVKTSMRKGGFMFQVQSAFFTVEAVLHLPGSAFESYNKCWIVSYFLFENAVLKPGFRLKPKEVFNETTFLNHFQITVFTEWCNFSRLIFGKLWPPFTDNQIRSYVWLLIPSVPYTFEHSDLNHLEECRLSLPTRICWPFAVGLEQFS